VATSFSAGVVTAADTSNPCKIEPVASEALSQPGDRIPRGRDSLVVVRVRHDDERDVLVVRSGPGPKSD
jgi:hypothetical protein